MAEGPIARMRIGVVLPIFREDLDEARKVLQHAEEAGLDGVFVHDHLWPMRHREQPAISAFPVLGALSTVSSSMMLGTLVARISTVDPEVVFRQLVSVYECSGHRFIAGIGTGDSKGAEEFSAYGLDLPPAALRRRELRELSDQLQRHGLPVWVGGGSPTTNSLAFELGATLNMWGVSTEEIRAYAQQGPVTWAGNLPRDPQAARVLVGDLAAARASWAIFVWPGSPAVLRDALVGLDQG